MDALLQVMHKSTRYVPYVMHNSTHYILEVMCKSTRYIIVDLYCVADKMRRVDTKCKVSCACNACQYTLLQVMRKSTRYIPDVMRGFTCYFSENFINPAESSALYFLLFLSPERRLPSL